MKVASIEITTACNLTCEYCQRARTNKFMEEATFKQILTACRESGCQSVALGGGEPLLHPALEDFLYLAREAGFLTALTTNATLPERVYRLRNLDHLGVSCGKGKWEILLNRGNKMPFLVTANILLIKGGLQMVRLQAARAFSLGCRRFMFIAYKGDQEKFYPSHEELVSLLALGSFLAGITGATAGLDAYTYRRLGLHKSCREDFIRFDVAGHQQPCCFPTCEFY